MHIVKFKNYYLGWFSKIAKLPESWDQMDFDSLVFVCKTLTEYDEMSARGIILRHFLKIKLRIFLKLDDGQLYDLLECINWITLKGLRSQLFQSFHSNWTLPDNDFKDGLCYEFAKADHYYNLFKNSGSQVDLDMFFASLTRYKGRSVIDDIVDDRSTGNKVIDAEIVIKKRARKLKSMPQFLKLVTLAYFSGIKEYVFKTYGPWLFASALDDGPKSSVNLGWWGVFFSVSESGVFGNLDQVYRYNFHDVCSYLVQKKEEHILSTRQAKAS